MASERGSGDQYCCWGAQACQPPGQHASMPLHTPQSTRRIAPSLPHSQCFRPSPTHHHEADHAFCPSVSPPRACPPRWTNLSTLGWTAMTRNTSPVPRCFMISGWVQAGGPCLAGGNFDTRKTSRQRRQARCGRKKGESKCTSVFKANSDPTSGGATQTIPVVSRQIMPVARQARPSQQRSSDSNWKTSCESRRASSRLVASSRRLPRPAAPLPENSTRGIPAHLAPSTFREFGVKRKL